MKPNRPVRLRPEVWAEKHALTVAEMRRMVVYLRMYGRELAREINPHRDCYRVACSSPTYCGGRRYAALTIRRLLATPRRGKGM